MAWNPYTKFAGKDLTLNDHLAIDRTVLANERTLLAYARTSLAMLIIGGTLYKFFEDWWVHAVGGVFIAAGFVVFARGWRRYNRTRRFLAVALQQQTGSPEHPLKGDVDEKEASDDEDEPEPARLPER